MVDDVFDAIVRLGSTVSLKKSGWTHNNFGPFVESLNMPKGSCITHQESLDLLGTPFTPGGECTSEVRARIHKMRGRYWQLKDVLCPRHISLEARLRLYNLSIRRTAFLGVWELALSCC